MGFVVQKEGFVGVAAKSLNYLLFCYFSNLSMSVRLGQSDCLTSRVQTGLTEKLDMTYRDKELERSCHSSNDMSAG